MAFFNAAHFVIETGGDGRRTVSLVDPGGGGGGTALPWYNVKDAAYGALGDGVTDDYDAFIAARDAIWTAGEPAVLYIPSGHYLSSNYIQLQSAADRPPIIVIGDWPLLEITTDTAFFYRKYDDSGDFSEVVQLLITNCFFTTSTPGSGTGVHTVDSWGTIVRNCHFADLKIGFHVQSVNSWNEGWVSQDNIFDNCTAGFDFNAPGGTGSFQSGRMVNTTIRTNASQKGIHIQSTANMYGSHFEFQIWPGGNNAIGINIDGNIHSCKFVGLVDNAGGGGNPLYGIQFGTNAQNTDRAQFSIDFAGTYHGGDAQANAVHNAFSKTWYYDPLPYGSSLYIRKSLVTLLGDIIYASAASTPARLAGNTTTTKKYLQQQGNGTISAAPAWSTIAASELTGGAALTKVDDTNVTLTLGGTPASALLAAASLTLGWTGQLAISRGGTGQATALAAFDALSPITTRGDLITRGASNNARLGVGANATILRSDGTDPSWSANLKVSGWSQVGSTSDPSNTTAGDGTAIRMFVGDVSAGTGVLKFQVNAGNVVASANATSYLSYYAATFKPATTGRSDYGIYVNTAIQPSATNTSSNHIGLGFQVTHDAGAFAVGSILGIFGVAEQAEASSTAAELDGAQFIARHTDGTTTLAKGLYVNVTGSAGTLTTGIGIDIDRGQFGGTYSTGIGLRIGAVSGTIGTDIAIQSLGGQNRFVGSVQIGQNTAPAVELAVFAGTTARMHLQTTSSGSTSADGLQIALSTADAYIWNFENGPLHIATNNVERVTMPAAGGFNIVNFARVGSLSNPTNTTDGDFQAIRGFFTTSVNVGGTGVPSPAGLTVSGSARIAVTTAVTLTGSLDSLYYSSGTITNNTAAVINGMHLGNTFAGNGDNPAQLLVRPFFQPSSPINEAYGASLAGVHNGGSIGDLIGFRPIVASFASSGSVTNFKGIRIDSPVYTGTTRATNAYGIHIQNQGFSGQTMGIGIYIEAQSGATNNYAMGFAYADLTAAGAYYGRIPVLYNGLLKYIHVFS